MGGFAGFCWWALVGGWVQNRGFLDAKPQVADAEAEVADAEAAAAEEEAVASAQLSALELLTAMMA